MVYQGSKARLRKDLLPILQGCIVKNKVDTYIEPFVGGANMIDHIRCKTRIGSDINEELIALLQYMQKDPLLSIAPADCSFEHYTEVRENRKNKTGKYSAEYTALIGYFASYGGRYFSGGYGRDSKGGRCIYTERLANARKQAPLLKRIQFFCRDYKGYKDVKNAVIYLDPPYKGTKEYVKSSMDYEVFYSFARQLAYDNYVFISEFSMPDDFICIWSKEKKLLQKSDRKMGKVAVEKLYTIGLSAKWIKNKEKIQEENYEV